MVRRFHGLKLFAWWALTFSATAAEISITELNDVDFGPVSPTMGVLQERLRTCVNMTPPGPFQMLGLGYPGSGTFTLTSSAGESIDYSVAVQNRGRHTMLPGIPVTGLMARQPRPTGDCQPPFTHIIIEIDSAQLQAAPGGRYRGTLELTVIPE